MIGKMFILNLKKTQNSSLEGDISQEKITSKNQFKAFFEKINPKKLSFFISSYNSRLWNMKASTELQKLNKGKLVDFKNVGVLFFPRHHNFISHAFCYVKGYAFSGKEFKAHKKVKNRSLLVTTTVFPEKVQNDEIFKNKYKIRISFILPTGSYATMIIKQIFLMIEHNKRIQKLINN